MAKFRKKKLSGGDQINTSALPDIIFMLLFFFMVTTVLREQDVLVDQKRERKKDPQANLMVSTGIWDRNLLCK